MNSPSASGLSILPPCLRVVVCKRVSGCSHRCKTLCLMVGGIDCTCGSSVACSACMLHKPAKEFMIRVVDFYA